MSRNIVLDCGTHEAQGLCELASNFPKQCEIYCFEPNPSIDLDEEAIKVLATTAGIEFSSLTLHKKAIWISNEGVKFASIGGFPRGTQNLRGQASSIANISNHNRIKEDLTNVTNIPSVDLVYFIRLLNLDTEDKLYIKMDIEGAEFEVISKLLEATDVHKNISHMWIEWHQRYFDVSVYQPLRDKLVDSLKSVGIHVDDWY